MAYVVTAQKPTKVTHSALGNFTGADDLNLIVARGTRFELHVATEEGLSPVFDVAVYGRIATMELFRPADEPKDLLFMSTERHGVCVLEFDAAKQQLVTRATGDVADPIGLGADCGQICSIDPQCRMIALHLIAGVLKVIPITAATRSLEAFNVRLDELQLLDMTMLHGTAQPTVAVLYQDNREARHVRTYKIDIPGKSASDGPWAKPNVDPGAAMLIPVPFGGVLIVGEQSIVYYNGTTTRDVAVSGMSIKAYGRMDKDGSRYLLGDHIGGLHALVLKHEGGVVDSLLIEPLGETSIASTISYLDNSIVFIGGCFGDSQLVQLNEEKDEETNSYLELLESHTNLGPIIDMAVVDLDRQGQGLVVTCSGASKDGSLRIVRNGIGIEEQAVIPLPGAKGVWSLRESFASPHDKYLVQSFIGETRIFEISEEKLDETEIAGFDDEVQTLLCGNMVGDTLLQVTDTVVRLVSIGEGKEVARWAPDAGARVTVAACSPTQVLLALTGGILVYLDAAGGALSEAGRKTMPHEISCLALNPLPASAASTGAGAGSGAGAGVGVDGDTDMGAPEAAEAPQTASLAAVGLWTDITARIVRLPSLEEVWQESLGGEIQPRSVLLTSLEGTAYVLVALGDGHLFIFVLDPATGALKDGRRVSLGTQPISLATFNTNGEQHVFAACDRPTVLYSSGGKLLFSNVNLSEVTTMCPFNSASFPDCLALASEADITIGTVDEIQKLHIRTVHLGEQPRRICHHKQSKCVAVCTIRTSIEKGEEVETNHLRLVDSTSFDIVGNFALQAFEMALSMTPVVFEGSDKEYIAVGTAYVYDDEEEPSSGRILVFSVVGSEGDRDVALEADREIRGGAFALEAFQGGLIAGVNTVVQMYSWREGEDSRALVAGPKHQGHILALNLQTRGHFVLVGDLMKSMTLLAYNEVEKRLDEIARDPAANWMSAVAILDDNTFIGAENSYNIFTCSKALDALADEDHSRLLTSGAFHLGEFVNCFRHGSMVMDPSDSKVEEAEAGEGAAASKGKGKGKGKSPAAGAGAGAGAGSSASAKPKPRLVFGTVNGALGVVATLPKPMFAFLSRMQTAMAKVVPGVGGFSHAEWRAFRNERLPEPQPAHGFIDGDLVETFLDLDREKMVQVVAAMNGDGQGGDDGDVTVDALTRLVEDLVRLH